MKKFIILALLVLGSFVGAFGQVSTNPIIRSFGAPVGTCPTTKLYLNMTNGSVYSCNAGVWTAIGGGGGGSVAGLDTQVQFNDAAAFGADAGLTYVKATDSLTVAGQYFTTATVTAAGTTGARTINNSAGSVNFAASATSLIVTSNKVTTNSIVLCTVATNDTTLKSVQCVAGAGTFTMFANASATAETRVNFWVLNQ